MQPAPAFVGSECVQQQGNNRRQGETDMTCRLLIVEDEIFVAIEVETVLEEMGHRSVGIAADSRRAMELAPFADIALVDLNLTDGPTGIEVGRKLADRGITVVYITANPSQLGNGVPGTLGVIAKPLDDRELRAAIRYVVAAHHRDHPEAPPRRLRLFNPGPGFAEQPSG